MAFMSYFIFGVIGAMWHESRILNRALLKAGKDVDPGICCHLDSDFEGTPHCIHLFFFFKDIQKKQGFHRSCDLRWKTSCHFR